MGMKAIVYASVHHGNTRKVVEAIAKECEVELIDAAQVKKRLKRLRCRRLCVGAKDMTRSGPLS